MNEGGAAISVLTKIAAEGGEMAGGESMSGGGVRVDGGDGLRWVPGEGEVRTGTARWRRCCWCRRRRRGGGVGAEIGEESPRGGAQENSNSRRLDGGEEEWVAALR